MKTILLCLAVTLAVPSLALAESPGGASPGGPPSPSATGPQGATGPTRRAPRTPPPEAVAACSGKAVGAACTFQHKDRTETGTCFTPDPAQAIACKPVRPPREEGSEGGR